MANELVALRSEMKQMHNGILLFRGDPFVASKEEAAEMIALGIASLRKDQVIETKVVSIKRGPGRPRKDGRYQRRDMRAED